MWRASAREIRAVTGGPGSASAGFGQRGLGTGLADGDPAGWQVEPLGVFAEHPRRRELPQRGRHRAAHDREPVGWDVVRVAGVVARDDLLLEDPVEVLRVGPVLGGFVGVGLATADGPAVVVGEALVPPAVEDADVRDAVLGRLHPGRARRLQRSSRVVEPDIDPLDEVAPDSHVVVLEDEDPAAHLRRARDLEDLLDDLLSRAVGGVRLAGEDHLERALGVPEHPGQPVDVGEQQSRPLVGREPAGEPDGQDRRVERGIELGQHGRRLPVPGELAAQPALGEMRELALLAQVRVPQVARRDALDALPEAALLRGRVEVVEVGVEVALEQVRDRGADPGGSVDAVGDAQDPVVHDPGPRPVGGLRVELAHRVGAVGQAQREGRHVELRAVVVGADPQLEDLVDRHAAPVEQGAGHAPHEVGVEPLVPGGDRRMDREHAVGADRRPGTVQRGPAGHELAGAFGEQERGVALVEVPDRRLEAEGPDRTDAADAEDQLLVEPHLAAADVQDVGDRAVRLVVLGQVRVEQQDRHPADLGEPDRDGEVPARAAPRSPSAAARCCPGPG